MVWSVVSRLFVFVIVVVSFAGCSEAVKVSAVNRDASYQTKLTRVLITTKLYMPSLSERQNAGFFRASELRQALTEKWTPLGIGFEIVDFNPATDQERVTAENAARFGAQQVLAAAVTSTRLYQGSVVDDYNVDVSIYDLATKKRVWRAAVAFGGMAESGRIRHNGFGGAISHQNDANEFVDALTAKLKASGLL